MSDRFEDLPEDIRQRFWSFLHVNDDGSWECPDRRGLLDFINESAEAYPALLDFVKVDDDRLMAHVRETGEVPPGIEIIKTTTAEGSNVTQLRIYRGGTTIPEDER